MRVLLVSNSFIPVFAYGGTERVIWDLGQALVELGHEVTYLVAAGSSCPFAKVLEINPAVDLRLQIPVDIDIVHFQFNPAFDLDADFDKPYVVTEHANTAGDKRLPLNSIFVSCNHAQRHGSEQFVHFTDARLELQNFGCGVTIRVIVTGIIVIAVIVLINHSTLRPPFVIEC